MNVFEEVANVISERLGVSKEEIQENSLFKDDLGADSLDIVELVMELEDSFGIEIADEDAEKIQTVGDAVDYIKKQQ